ncbi:MAG TPA: TOBE domain-containing protein [Gemmatimonadaceae bacterium]
MPELLNVREAAVLLHLHVKRVQTLAREGKIPAVRHGRKWLFRRADLVHPSRAPLNAAPVAHAGEQVEISARNRLRGRIVELRADGVMAEVRLAVGDQELVAIITSSSAERLRLRVGDEVFAIVKATEVMVAKATK